MWYSTIVSQFVQQIEYELNLAFCCTAKFVIWKNKNFRLISLVLTTGVKLTREISYTRKRFHFF